MGLAKSQVFLTLFTQKKVLFCQLTIARLSNSQYGFLTGLTGYTFCVHYYPVLFFLCGPLRLRVLCVKIPILLIRGPYSLES